ncbi:MAG: LacI family transcriptional regulator [Naasia sp.]|uniref:LacI family DNA-binding transcriptional regulator n=1 Tax=Naasia sp. TaxID=2546198 RepID=UPI0026238281|nr:LacI family DNA-binding transcriptional regulator [Naasia sp.]MCU1571407.1 LacI family transcriptional regulator [Naasia sp.]
MATIHDVARHAGVSAGTVSNVLNRPGYVSVDTRERVLRVIADLGFTPSRVARKFPPGRQRTLGLALADLANPFFVDVAIGAEEEAKSLGVGVVMVHSGEDAGREQDNLDVLVQQRVHGIMITPVHEDESLLDRLDARGIPLVFVDRVSERSERCWVKTDDVAGGRLAGEHLGALGHEHIAFAGSLGKTVQVDRRYDGFAEALSSAGRGAERLITDSWRIADGRMVGAALAGRTRDRLPTAVMCANDYIALGILAEFARHGIRVPEDVTIIGFDDHSWAEAATVPMTTVRQPREVLGRRAVRLLLDEIDHGDAHVHAHELLEPTLIVRSSSAAPRLGRSPRVSRA